MMITELNYIRLLLNVVAEMEACTMDQWLSDDVSEFLLPCYWWTWWDCTFYYVSIKFQLLYVCTLPSVI